MAVFKFSLLLQELVVFLTLHRYTFAESSCFPPVGIGGIALGRRTLGAEVLIFAARTNIDITLHWLALVSLVGIGGIALGRRTLGAADQKTLSPAPMNTFAPHNHQENLSQEKQ